jgi:hypothetical protein
MNHPTEDELVLHYYGEGESARPEAIPTHLGVCADCRGRLEALAADLAQFDRLAVPARGESYGRELWQRLRPQLPEAAPRRPPIFGWPAWILSGSLAALLAAAFLAGRFWPRTPAAPAAASIADVRERILIAEVADHLDRSQIALLEFLHADPSSDPEAERERHFAEDLVASSRIYRQTAASAGEAGLASLLDGLERTLLQIAHSTTPEACEALKRRIESDSTLFKLRILRAQLGRRQKAGAPPPAVRS